MKPFQTSNLRLEPLSSDTAVLWLDVADRPVNVSTLARLAAKGIRLSDGSRVRLEAIRTPSAWLSCEEWLHSFLDAITADRVGDNAPPADAPRTTASRRRELKRVDRELYEAGF